LCYKEPVGTSLQGFMTQEFGNKGGVFFLTSNIAEIPPNVQAKVMVCFPMVNSRIPTKLLEGDIKSLKQKASGYSQIMLLAYVMVKLKKSQWT